MDKTELYESLIQLGIHLEVKRKHLYEVEELGDVDLQQVVLEIHKILNDSGNFSGVLDKSKIIKQAKDKYLNKFDEDINDSVLIEPLISELEKSDANTKKIFIDEAVYIAKKNDNEICAEEKNILEYLFNKFNIANESLDSYMQQSLKSRKSKGKKADNNQLYLIAAGAVSVVILVGIFIFLFSKGSAVSIEKTKLSNIVYKKIFFERYVVAGNYNGGSINNKFGKMVIFYIKGNADVKFDLQNLKLKKNGEEYTAVYFNKKAKKKLSINSLPFTIDVNIDQHNSEEVKEIQPEEISIAEAKKVAAPVGVLAGIGGGVIGAKLGASVGSATGNPIFSLAGLGIGGVASGAAAGAGAYVATTNFLTGLQLTSNIEQGDKEKILHKSKLLVASDLLMNDSIANKLTKDFEKYVKSFYEQFGIEVSKISYQNQA